MNIHITWLTYVRTGPQKKIAPALFISVGEMTTGRATRRAPQISSTTSLKTGCSKTAYVAPVMIACLLSPKLSADGNWANGSANRWVDRKSIVRRAAAGKNGNGKEHDWEHTFIDEPTITITRTISMRFWSAVDNEIVSTTNKWPRQGPSLKDSRFSGFRSLGCAQPWVQHIPSQPCHPAWNPYGTGQRRFGLQKNSVLHTRKRTSRESWLNPSRRDIGYVLLLWNHYIWEHDPHCDNKSKMQQEKCVWWQRS